MAREIDIIHAGPQGRAERKAKRQAAYERSQDAYYAENGVDGLGGGRRGFRNFRDQGDHRGGLFGFLASEVTREIRHEIRRSRRDEYNGPYGDAPPSLHDNGSNSYGAELERRETGAEHPMLAHVLKAKDELARDPKNPAKLGKMFGLIRTLEEVEATYYEETGKRAVSKEVWKALTPEIGMFEDFDAARTDSAHPGHKIALKLRENNKFESGMKQGVKEVNAQWRQATGRNGRDIVPDFDVPDRSGKYADDAPPGADRPTPPPSAGFEEKISALKVAHAKEISKIKTDAGNFLEEMQKAADKRITVAEKRAEKAERRAETAERLVGEQAKQIEGLTQRLEKLESGANVQTSAYSGVDRGTESPSERNAQLAAAKVSFNAKLAESGGFPTTGENFTPTSHRSTESAGKQGGRDGIPT